MNNSKLLEAWLTASCELDLEIILSFILPLENDKKITVEFMLRNFGAKNGMLIVTDHEIIKPYWRQIINLGYGYSVLSEFTGNAPCFIDDFKDVLRDWGWSGEKSKTPTWL